MRWIRWIVNALGIGLLLYGFINEQIETILPFALFCIGLVTALQVAEFRHGPKKGWALTYVITSCFILITSIYMFFW